VAELSPRVFFHQVGRMVANVPETSNLANISCTPAVIGLLAMLSSAPFYAQTQTPLEAIVKSERANSSVLNYTQVSVYEHGEAVQYHGVLFLHLDAVILHDCALTATVTVQDRYSAAEDRRQRFSGMIAHRETKEKVDTYHYTYTMDLRKTMPSAVGTVVARPFQLKDDARLRCSEEHACTISWLQLQSASPEISETRETNGFEDVHADVRQMLIPMSSADSAAVFVERLRNDTRLCHPSSVP